MLLSSVLNQVGGRTYPNNNSSWFVACSDNKIGTFRNMIEEELEQPFRLFVLESNDASCETLVYVECLLAGYRVFSYERVL